MKRLFFILFLIFVTPIEAATIGGMTLQYPNTINVWANNGSEKVVRTDLRVTEGREHGLNLDARTSQGVVDNYIWNPSTQSIENLFGFRNEFVPFSVYIEAQRPQEGLTIEMSTLTSGGNTITGTTRACDDDLFDYRGRNIEHFYVRYLELFSPNNTQFESSIETTYCHRY